MGSICVVPCLMSFPPVPNSPLHKKIQNTLSSVPEVHEGAVNVDIGTHGFVKEMRRSVTCWIVVNAAITTIHKKLPELEKCVGPMA